MLGTKVVGLLRQRQLEVRVLTRDRNRAADLASTGVDIVEGDVGDPAAVRRAVDGVDTVVSAIHGFAGPNNTGTPATVDRDGNHNLIKAAREAGVEHMVLLSVWDASPDHPMDLNRMKYAAEEDLKASGLAWTILRPGPYMELWCELLGRPLLEKGKTQVFGRGHNPINYVSATDVARFVELSVVDPEMRGRVLDMGGPENLTMNQFVEVFQAETSSNGKVAHFPLAVMRVMAVLMKPINPKMARQVQAGIVMDTRPQAFDALETRRRYPSIPAASLAEVVRRDFRDSPGAATASVLAARS
ncbi:MAG: SDR family oxidoreductase [Candidatus Dormibacteraeota bacterium]|nr:SDR family oxidoreductase [Candidatus Dormibacteraeota bacterium]